MGPVFILATILDRSNEKLRPPFPLPPFHMEKWRVLRFAFCVRVIDLVGREGLISYFNLSKIVAILHFYLAGIGIQHLRPGTRVRNGSRELN